jgi:hypothetical protein
MARTRHVDEESSSGSRRIDAVVVIETWYREHIDTRAAQPSEEWWAISGEVESVIVDVSCTEGRFNIDSHLGNDSGARVTAIDADGTATRRTKDDDADTIWFSCEPVLTRHTMANVVDWYSGETRELGAVVEPNVRAAEVATLLGHGRHELLCIKHISSDAENYHHHPDAHDANLL